MIIAIDGPAGSGKGTITKILAEKLGIVNIETGAMYRSIALAALRKGLSVDDREALIELAKNVKIEFDKEGNTYLDGENVTNFLRTPEVNAVVSPISSIVEIREEMVKIQRAFAEGNSVIMEGRDITTVVFPNADYKFYLDASAEERANRRFKQNQESGIEMTYEEVLDSINQRDYNDMHKEVGALKRCNDQIYINSTDMKKEEVVNFILEKIGEVK